MMPFDKADVEAFVSELADVLPTFNPNDDHPFQNPFHSGDWLDEAKTKLGDEWAHIPETEHAAFITACEAQIARLGLGDGSGPDEG